MLIIVVEILSDFDLYMANIYYLLYINIIILFPISIYTIVQ